MGRGLGVAEDASTRLEGGGRGGRRENSKGGIELERWGEPKKRGGGRERRGRRKMSYICIQTSLHLSLPGGQVWVWPHPPSPAPHLLLHTAL